ncbi:MAG: hypothetical protein Q7U96_02135, partial [Chloroflexota bacterium]|nr:hypothetical protein [Chloroflexota bacterium]
LEAIISDYTTYLRKVNDEFGLDPDGTIGWTVPPEAGGTGLSRRKRMPGYQDPPARRRPPP